MTSNPALDDLSIWTLYDHPSDFPDHFVARRWSVRYDAPTKDFLIAPTLDALREMVQSVTPYLLERFEREPHDDARIVETWL
jgi:hypothetical protein